MVYIRHGGEKFVRWESFCIWDLRWACYGLARGHVFLIMTTVKSSFGIGRKMMCISLFGFGIDQLETKDISDICGT